MSGHTKWTTVKTEKKCATCDKKRAPGRSYCYGCYGKKRRLAKKITIRENNNMRILMIDIETQPNLGWFWDIWSQNIGINQISDATEMLCFAAKWYGEEEVMFHASWDDETMVEKAWHLLNEADVVIHYYGTKFDVPHLNREFLLRGYTPPSPFKQVDLKTAVSKRFKFTSNKLQFVSEQLGLAGKMEHEGFPLWRKVMEGDQDARDRMQAYNEQDVVLLEEVYEILLPWIPSHPHRHLYSDTGECPTCGLGPVNEAGIAYTRLSKFQQYTCDNCGSFFRSSRRIGGVFLQESVL